MTGNGSAMTNAIVLDSWSVIAYLQNEATGAKVGNWIADVIETGGDVLMSVVNIGEVWYIFAREQSIKNADAVIADLQKIGVQFISADWALTKIAAAFKARGGLSYADAFAAAGFDVWWDTALRSGEAYDEVTEAALRGAKAVVVL